MFAIGWSLFGMKHIDSKLLPLIFSSVGLILAIIALWRNVREMKRREVTTGEIKTEIGDSSETWGGYLRNGFWVVGFLLAIYVIGLLTATAFFLLFYMKWLGTRWRIALVYAVVATVMVYLIFEVTLDIVMYHGILFTWFGG